MSTNPKSKNDRYSQHDEIVNDNLGTETDVQSDCLQDKEYCIIVAEAYLQIVNDESGKNSASYSAAGATRATRTSYFK